MRKKLILTLILMLGFIFFVSCDGTSTTEEPTIIETTETPTTEEPTTVIQEIELPDLDGLTLSEVETLLNNNEINYTISYQTNLEINEDLFVAYGNGLSAGDMINSEDEVEIIISTQTLILPDLTGLDVFEIDRYFIDRGINNYDVDIVTDNTVEDETFAGYESYEIGDQVSLEDEFMVLIGYNSAKLPELDGKIERQINTLLTESNITYEIIYVENDEYPAGSFAYYVDHEAGDFYDEVSTIQVAVYSNSFTDADESLFISKYIDSETDSAIEIYNPTDSTIDLNDYHIAIFENGSYELSHRIELGDNLLEPGETFLVVSTTSEADLQRKYDLRTADLVFDGNDTVQLRYKNDTYIDTIYQIGDRALIMDNETFVRREGVSSGTRTFRISEWSAFVPNYYEFVGTHPINLEGEPRLDALEIAELITRGFYHPLGGMVQQDYSNTADGDTAYFSPDFLGDERVRFIGNDTPETSPAVVDQPEPWGLEAKAYTKTILEYADYHDLPIYVQSDPDIGYTEGYGRHLGLIWVDLGDHELSIDIETSDGQLVYTEVLTGMTLINYHLVKNGFTADEYSSVSFLTNSNRYMHRWFDEAEKFAKDNNLGIHE
jgi:endonuclease YncB( thermonuclease family)